jgi:hypothetical protein
MGPRKTQKQVGVAVLLIPVFSKDNRLYRKVPALLLRLSGSCLESNGKNITLEQRAEVRLQRHRRSLTVSLTSTISSRMER